MVAEGLNVEDNYVYFRRFSPSDIVTIIDFIYKIKHTIHFQCKLNERFLSLMDHFSLVFTQSHQGGYLHCELLYEKDSFPFSVMTMSHTAICYKQVNNLCPSIKYEFLKIFYLGLRKI